MVEKHSELVQGWSIDITIFFAIVNHYQDGLHDFRVDGCCALLFDILLYRSTPTMAKPAFEGCSGLVSGRLGANSNHLRAMVKRWSCNGLMVGQLS